MSDHAGGPPPLARWARLRRLLGEYLKFRFEFISGFMTPFSYVRKLPSPTRRLLWPGLIMTAVIVLSAPAVVMLVGGPVARFLDVENQPQTIPLVGLLLAGSAFAFGWAYLLNGAAEGPWVAWVGGGLLYTYLVVTVGLFTIGESYLHAIPLALPVVIGSLTLRGSRWGKVLVAVLLASIIVRLIPEQASVRWYLLWIPAAAALIGIQAILRRRAPLTSLTRLGLAAGVLGLYFAVVGHDLVRLGGVAENLNLVLTEAIGLLGLIWFFSGPLFVPGALGLANFGAKLLDLILPERVPIWAQMMGWAVIGGWLTGFPHGIWGTRTGLATGIFAGTAALVAARARMHMVPRQWISAAFIIAIAALVIVHGLTTMDIRSVVRRNSGVLSLLGFTYAIVWDVVSRLPRLPTGTRTYPEPALLLIYLGSVLLVAAATLFGLAANLPSFQQLIALRQYEGALALGIPVILLTAASRWSRFTPELRRRTMLSFALGVAASIPAFLARAASLWPELANPLSATVVLLLPMVLISRWPVVQSAAGGGAIGAALSYGFAVGLSQRIFVDVLQSLLIVFAAVLGVRPVAGIAFQIRGLADVAVWRPDDARLFYFSLPIAAALVGVAMGVILRRRQGE